MSSPPPLPVEPAKTTLQSLAERLRSLANLPDWLSDLFDEQLATTTRSLAAALPAFPAATLGSLALGLPHAHPAHPPFTAAPPMGPILVGCNPRVLINGLPAAVLGSLGVSPTCGGLTPFFEVTTGSSKVFIGGQRAARMFDLTAHCRSSPSHPTSPGPTAGPTPPLGDGRRALATAHRAEQLLDHAATASELAAAGEAALFAPTTAHRERGAIEAVATTLELVTDPLKEAMSHLMGLDPTLPVGGTPGAVLLGSSNVLIGGFPVPSASSAGAALRQRVGRWLHRG